MDVLLQPRPQPRDLSHLPLPPEVTAVVAKTSAVHFVMRRVLMEDAARNMGKPIARAQLVKNKS
jgi:hypothetical protein